MHSGYRRLPPRLRHGLGHLGRGIGVLLVAVIGSSIGAALAPSTTTEVGPFQVEVRVVPSLRPEVALELPPAGRVEFATHRAPVSVQVAIGEVDLEGARRLIGSRAELDQVEASAAETLQVATVQAAATSAACALTGAVALSVLVYRKRARRTAEVAATLVVVLALTAGATVSTFDPDRMAQPHFTGLLSKAPYIAGQAESMVQRLQNYRMGLAQIVQGVTAVYATSSDLPTVPSTTEDDVVTLLHVSDIHLNPIAFDLITRLVQQFKVNLVVDSGDITTWGTEAESATLSRVRQVGVPYVFVRGNHDSRTTQQAVAASSNAVVLDGDVAEVAGVVIAGIGDPIFTPDVPPYGPGPPSPAATSRSSGGPPSTSAGASSTSAGAPSTPTPTSGARTVPPGEFESSTDPEVRAGTRLAALIRGWDAAHPGRKVAVAAVHEPFATPPLMGAVPLILAGHFHEWMQSVDARTGTRLMIEGSTGGSGVTATGVEAARQGKPTPLSATLIYLARKGPRAGQVLAYDQVTVGGLGLASITLSRTVIRPEESPAATPGSATTPGVAGTPGAADTSGSPGPSGNAGAGSGSPPVPSPAVRPSPSGTSLPSPPAGPPGASARPGVLAVGPVTSGGGGTPGAGGAAYAAERGRLRRIAAS
ncbi:MAG TPA: metallophosphoesterase [Kineosporiaceae bacterium]|nr:metallophosphoesterase [Kineosporiaceae bacterium]